MERTGVLPGQPAWKYAAAKKPGRPPCEIPGRVQAFGTARNIHSVGVNLELLTGKTKEPRQSDAEVLNQARIGAAQIL